MVPGGRGKQRELGLRAIVGFVRRLGSGQRSKERLAGQGRRGGWRACLRSRRRCTLLECVGERVPVCRGRCSANGDGRLRAQTGRQLVLPQPHPSSNPRPSSRSTYKASRAVDSSLPALLRHSNALGAQRRSDGPSEVALAHASLPLLLRPGPTTGTFVLPHPRLHLVRNVRSGLQGSSETSFIYDLRSYAADPGGRHGGKGGRALRHQEIQARQGRRGRHVYRHLSECHQGDRRAFLFSAFCVLEV